MGVCCREFQRLLEVVDGVVQLGGLGQEHAEVSVGDDEHERAAVGEDVRAVAEPSLGLGQLALRVQSVGSVVEDNARAETISTTLVDRQGEELQLILSIVILVYSCEVREV